MKKQKYCRRNKRRSKSKDFRWRIPSNNTSSRRIHFSNEYNYLNKNGTKININNADESDSGTVVGTPSSNNSVIDLIIKKSLETDSYLNEIKSNSESKVECSEISYLSDYKEESLIGDIKIVQDSDTIKNFNTSNMNVGNICQSNEKSKEDFNLIEKLNSHQLKKRKSSQIGKNDLMSNNSNGSGLNTKNGFRRCYDVVIKKVNVTEKKKDSFITSNESTIICKENRKYFSLFERKEEIKSVVNKFIELDCDDKSKMNQSINQINFTIPFKLTNRTYKRSRVEIRIMRRKLKDRNDREENQCFLHALRTISSSFPIRLFEKVFVNKNISLQFKIANYFLVKQEMKILKYRETFTGSLCNVKKKYDGILLVVFMMNEGLHVEPIIDHQYGDKMEYWVLKKEHEVYELDLYFLVEYDEKDIGD